jgi:hypothetical protein
MNDDRTDYESLSKGISRDMSPQAIAERLRIAAELYEFARVFLRAPCLGPVDPAAVAPGGRGATAHPDRAPRAGAED